MLLQFLIDKGASSDLAALLVEIAHAVQHISESIIHTSTGKAGTLNAYGEDQLAMDVRAESIMAETMQRSPFVAAYGSEELDHLETVRESGRFSVFYDPLDGSSLFDVNFAVGTIVGIYEGATIVGRTPREQVAALYAMYGPKTTLVLSVGKGVHEFQLTAKGWELVTEALSMKPAVDANGKAAKKFFAPGNLRATAEREDYFDLVAAYIKEAYTLRYSGGMVPDVNHLLKKGSGIFLYPGMASAPDGKLRLLFECGPMAYLVEQAGGASSSGVGRDGAASLLDTVVRDLTQRSPIFIGQKEEVARAVGVLR